MRQIVLCGAAMILIAGCAGRKSSLLLERSAVGPVTEEAAVARQALWAFEPATQTLTKEGIEATVTFLSHRELLENFFANKKIFGAYAGLNPYFPENVVFSVKLANHTGGRIRIDPNEFVLLDDRGNQYSPLSADYITALAEYHGAFATFTRGLLEDAKPGYFGIGLPVGKMIGKPQRRIALLKLASLQGGVVHDGVVCDGLIAFWNPHEQVQHAKLMLANIKTTFDPKDWPQAVVDFSFEFTVIRRTP